MAEKDRKSRFAGRLKRLIDVAIEQKNVGGGASIARMVMALEGWNYKGDGSEQDTYQPTDMSSLLQHIDNTEKEKQ